MKSTDINLVAILKDRPRGTKLYSSILGTCTFTGLNDDENYPIGIVSSNGKITASMMADGKYDVYGECLLFPSRAMRDWERFSWKIGDVLSCGVDNFCIFDSWANDDYTEFHSKYNSVTFGNENALTLKWIKANNEKSIQQYISNIEEIKGGKLNLDTLEIEREPQFKDGDILHSDETELSDETIFIAKFNGKKVKTYAYIDLLNKEVSLCTNSFEEEEYKAFRLATDSEKQQLFAALEKEGKKWNPDTKQIEDLPKKCELKAFDKVLVRDTKHEYWRPAFFASLDEDSINEYGYCLIGDPDGVFCKYCIPYNEETAHLLGTTDDYEN